MASFYTMPNGRIRAQLCVKGKRTGAVFANLQQAEAWADVQEAALGRAVDGLISRLPPRVLQAIADIDHSHADVVAGAIPFDGAAGVYFLIRSGEVVYVGKSVNVFDRIGAHRRQGGAWFDSFNVIRCPLERMAELEEKYILAFMPKMNTALTYKKAQGMSATGRQGTGRNRRAKASATNSHTFHTASVDQPHAVDS